MPDDDKTYYYRLGVREGREPLIKALKPRMEKAKLAEPNWNDELECSVTIQMLLNWAYLEGRMSTRRACGQTIPPSLPSLLPQSEEEHPPPEEHS